jgi:hypothetical protein
MSRLQARGTLRIVLNRTGLSPGSLRVAQLRAIALRLLPKELRARGVPECDSLCRELASCPPSVETEAAERLPEDPEEVFKRMGPRDRNLQPPMRPPSEPKR